MDYSHSSLIWLRRCGQRLGILRPFVRAYRRMFAIKYEQNFDAIMLSQVCPGDTVWDIGANIGFFTDKFAAASGPSGSVVAFEPSPGAFEALQKSHGGGGRVKLENIALADFDGEADFHVSHDGTDPTNGLFSSRPDMAVRKVKVLRGDTYRAAHGDLVPTRIKIDVEGYEYEVVKGLQETLKSGPLQSVFIEVHFATLAERGMPEAPTKITGLLRESGFDVRWADSGHIIATRSPGAPRS